MIVQQCVRTCGSAAWFSSRPYPNVAPVASKADTMVVAIDTDGMHAKLSAMSV